METETHEAYHGTWHAGIIDDNFGTLWFLSASDTGHVAYCAKVVKITDGFYTLTEADDLGKVFPYHTPEELLRDNEANAEALAALFDEAKDAEEKNAILIEEALRVIRYIFTDFVEAADAIGGKQQPIATKIGWDTPLGTEDRPEWRMEWDQTGWHHAISLHRTEEQERRFVACLQSLHGVMGE